MQLILLFCIKVAAGIFYGYYYGLPYQIVTSDTWIYFKESLVATDWLLHNPKAFVADLFTNHYSNTGGLFTSYNSFWSDLKGTFFIKVLAVLNVISFKNYWINILFFNTFYMYGCVALFKLIKKYFIINNFVLIASVFLMPTFLFWCSGIHKDGIIFSCIAISLFCFQNLLYKGFSIKPCFYLILSLFVIFILRNYVLLAIFPALFSWLLVNKFLLNSKLVFATTIFLCLLLLVCSSLINITKPISSSIVVKHNEFLSLEGNTKFKVPSLDSTPKSIAMFMPVAISNAIFRPYPTQLKSKFEIFVVVENYAIIILTIFSIIKMRKQKFNSPLIYVFLTISFLLLLFIGYTVCFSGAIVRYRSVVLPFMITPIVLLILGKESITLNKK